MRAALALLLLSSCAGPGATAERVRLIARQEAAPEGATINAYDGSSDQRMTVSFRVVQVLEGSFPDPYVLCSTHSSAILRTLLGNDPEGAPVELTLTRKSGEALYLLERRQSRSASRQSGQ